MADEISSMLSSIDLQDDTNSDSSAKKLPSSIDGNDSNSSSPKSIDEDSDSSSPKTPRSINSGDPASALSPKVAHLDFGHVSSLKMPELISPGDRKDLGSALDFGHVSSLKMPDLINHGDRKDPDSALSPKTISLTNHEAHLDFGPVSSLKMPDLINLGDRKDVGSALSPKMPDLISSPHGSVSSAGSAGSDDSVDCSTVCTMIQLQAAYAFSKGKLTRTNPNHQTPLVEVDNLPSLLLQNFNTGWGWSIDEVGPLNSVDIDDVLRIVRGAFEMAGKFLDSVQDASAKLLTALEVNQLSSAWSLAGFYVGRHLLERFHLEKENDMASFSDFFTLQSFGPTTQD